LARENGSGDHHIAFSTHTPQQAVSPHKIQQDKVGNHDFHSKLSTIHYHLLTRSSILQLSLKTPSTIHDEINYLPVPKSRKPAQRSHGDMRKRGLDGVATLLVFILALDNGLALSLGGRFLGDLGFLSGGLLVFGVGVLLVEEIAVSVTLAFLNLLCHLFSLFYSDAASPFHPVRCVLWPSDCSCNSLLGEEKEQNIPIINNGLDLHLLLWRWALLSCDVHLAVLDDWLAEGLGFRIEFFVGSGAEFGDAVRDCFGCHVDAVCWSVSLDGMVGRVGK